MASHSSVPITIVGAGIAGLVAAIALRQAGHEVTVFEQSRLVHEIGAAFHITPNACSVLSKLGINVHDGGAVDFHANVFLDQTDGQLVREIPKNPKFKNLPQGEDWVMAHRYHLHKQLKEKATEEGVQLLAGKRVTKVDSEQLQVFFEDGTTHNAQLLVGADGVHSKVRDSMHPDFCPFNTPWSAFRFLLDRKDIEEHPNLSQTNLLEPGKLYLWGQPDRLLMMYPTTRETQFNFVCLFPSNVLDIEVEHDSQYSHKASKEQLHYVYKDFEPRVQTLIELADAEHLRYWPLMDMADLPSYTTDRIALLGDAAHPFLPFAFQGAGLAIEDGASLAALLAGLVDQEKIAEALKNYEKLRHKRCAWEQQFSRDMFRDHSEDEGWNPTRIFEDIYLYRVLDEVDQMKKGHCTAWESPL